jgi:acetyltransferase-like isoleucine patch superfamily enzyme
MTAIPAMTPQQRELSDTKRSGLSTYRTLAVGDASLLHFVGYELAQWLFANTAGLIGFAARSFVYPLLFARCGKRPAIGRGVLLRIPQQISLGSGVLIDDNAALDVRGSEGSIEVGDRVSIGRLTTIAAKHGTIVLGPGCNIGSYCRIATNSRIEIGESALIGAYCYIGPGNHTEGTSEQPLITRPMDIKGGVAIGEHAWLGTRVTVLDGVRIGKRAIIGAHSLVKDDIPDDAVAVGVPAKVIRIRFSQDGHSECSD